MKSHKNSQYMIFGFPSYVFHVTLLAVKSPVLGKIIWYLLDLFRNLEVEFV